MPRPKTRPQLPLLQRIQAHEERKAEAALDEQLEELVLHGRVLMTVKRAGQIIDEQRAVASVLSRVPAGSGRMIGRA